MIGIQWHCRSRSYLDKGAIRQRSRHLGQRRRCQSSGKVLLLLLLTFLLLLRHLWKGKPNSASWSVSPEVRG